jgi:hypothetical protein
MMNKESIQNLVYLPTSSALEKPSDDSDNPRSLISLMRDKTVIAGYELNTPVVQTQVYTICITL